MELDGSAALTIPGPPVEVEEDEVSIQNIYFIPKAWAPYFLAPLPPILALPTYLPVL